jgi:hypothetical protein
MSRLPGTFAIVALVLLSCGKGADFYVHDTAVVSDTGAPFAQHPDFPARLESTIDAALRYWGGSWSDLAGMTITLEDGPYLTCGGSDRSLGCFDGNIRMATTDPGIGVFSCVETTVLVHEIGHAVIGDRMHQDPRWMDFAAVAEALAGRVGYSAGGEVTCDLYPSVWRHLPATP